MTDSLAALAALTQVLRYALFAGGVVIAVLATADWAVRTRRINPFNGLARFMRGRVEPRLAGIERHVIRAGGHPAATPWWALFGYVVLAALLLAGADLLLGVVADAAMAVQGGATGVLMLAVHWVFVALRVALLVRVVLSWLPRLASSRWLAWSVPATEWMLRPLRGVLPNFGMIDLSPIVAYFALQIAEWLVLSVLRSGPR